MTNVAIPRTELHSVQLVAVAAADITTVSETAIPTSAMRPAAASQTAGDTTATSAPDLLALAASILAYLNSLGLGTGPGLVAIGLSGLAATLAATAYVWNGFANLVNPVLWALRIPIVPTFPVCFAGQSCASPVSAQARSANRDGTAVGPASGLVKAASRGVATSKRVIGVAGGPTVPTRTARTTSTPAEAAAVGTNDTNNTATKVRGTKESTPSASGTGSSKRERSTAAH